MLLTQFTLKSKSKRIYNLWFLCNVLVSLGSGKNVLVSLTWELMSVTLRHTHKQSMYPNQCTKGWWYTNRNFILNDGFLKSHCHIIRMGDFWRKLWLEIIFWKFTSYAAPPVVYLKVFCKLIDKFLMSCRLRHYLAASGPSDKETLGGAEQKKTFGCDQNLVVRFHVACKSDGASNGYGTCIYWMALNSGRK